MFEAMDKGYHDFDYKTARRSTGRHDAHCLNDDQKPYSRSARAYSYDCTTCFAQAGAAETDRILDAGEACFKAMKQKDYAAIWESLSAKSQAAIVGDVAKRAAQTYSKEQIGADFSIGGLVAKSYWDEYLFYFDPDTVLEQSKWEWGPSVSNRQKSFCSTKRRSSRPGLSCSKKGISGK